MARRKHLTDSRLPPRLPNSAAAAARSAPLSSGPDERNRLWRLSSARSSPFSNAYLLHYPAFTVCRHRSAPSTTERREERRSLRCYIYEKQGVAPTLVVFTLFPVLQLHPLRSGSTLHSSPSMQGCIWHHHFCATMEAAAEKGKKGREQGGNQRRQPTT